ncbi:Inner membrane ABC transporter permease protein YcjP [Pseudovibrio sp. W64]|jgi:multiple sugar transport system permease protein|uniref:Carbohydrate ABC transporter membrane protein 2, CUT1 family n=1 Tax=Pseudovibrio ascidiaceicola TaxID=285279 RepID=A0A1I3X7W8_9HYPH|nr:MULTISPECIES: carbohydrate ABC transporter permease [Pseudovibrio]KZK90849.1 Inner membrane ABC transporter permease protein YcjP [Pseudovibrio sp. W64]KZK91267.1 Inner membrane ABC transporter permease protein YcjP [Pseudovibrio sp. Ad46]KZK94332.1 Inner membrane ABC transporter permease protein YcjP [Pseudovibrio sp. W74]KZL09854.1 Inner membrane ABC transporter permease protein YcjP [Pseudovibrio sp. Ad14]KZL13890.1 Inner membrane ABC transporter permease protein YcjP [Pseudovibrio sp. A
MMDRYSLPHKVFLYFCVVLFLGFILLPFFEMFMTSLRPLEHLFRSPYQFWSDDFSFKAYSQMWETVPMLPRYIANSMLISISVTALALAFVIPAAYAYARFDFKGKSLSLGIFLAVNMFSGAVLLIPLYKLLRNYGLLNTYFAMIVPGAAFLVPMGIWLLKSYLEKIPRELEEAAFMDGASRLYTLRRVVLPLAVPGLIVVGVAVFLSAYAQQFLFAITFNSVKEFMPLPAGILEFIGYQSVKWNQMMAASIVGILPVLVIFLFLQRYLVAGLTAGAIKE